MKTKTRLTRTSTITRDHRSSKLQKALADPATAPALWKRIGESPLLQPMRRDPKLGKNAADATYFSRDRSHCMLVDCQIRETGLSEAQAFLHLHQLAHHLQASQLPIKSASVVFLVEPGSPMLNKLLASFTETYKLPTAGLRKTNLSASIQGRNRAAKNACCYTVAITYKEEKFALPVTVRIVEADLGLAEPAPAPATAAPEAAAPLPPTVAASPVALRRYKELLDEAVSTRSAEAWKRLGESPTLLRTRGSDGADGPDMIYISRDRKHCLLVDLHVGAHGLDEAQTALHLVTLTQLLDARGFPIQTATLAFVLPPGAKELQAPPIRDGYAPPVAVTEKLKAFGAALRSPGKPAAKGGVSFAASLRKGSEKVEVELTVRWVEGPASVFPKA